MKTVGAVLIMVLNVLSAMRVFGQTPDITSFDHNGQIEWTNSTAGGAYRIEWAPSLSNGRWFRSWQSLSYVESTSNAVMAARVPMFYRVVAMTNIPPTGMSFVDAGTFLMGNSDTNAPFFSDEFPVHSVFVSAFFIDKFEVSNERMRQVLQWAYDHGKITATTSTVTNLEGDQQKLLDFKDWAVDEINLPGYVHHSQISFSNDVFHVEPGKEGHPATCVSWFGAQAYCNYRSDMEGLERCISFTDWTCDFAKTGYRLPTEVEWEKGARGGLEGHSFPWYSKGGMWFLESLGEWKMWHSEYLGPSKANYLTNFFQACVWTNVPSTVRSGYFNGSQSPVGYDMANGYGLYDMSGNAWEWCWDWYQADWYSQPEASADDPTGPAIGTQKILRGGSWDNDATVLRCSWRGTHEEPSGTNGVYYGFRTVCRQ